VSKQPIAVRFAEETAEHEMTILHADGLHRHVAFRNPKRAWNLWFDLITVPGALIFQGDGDSYVFQRDTDMFEFFRTSAYKGRPELHYWAEKLTSGRGSVKSYRQERLAENVTRAVAEYYEDTTVPAGLMDQVRKHVLDKLCGDQSLDLRVVDRFSFYKNEDDRYDFDVQPDFVFQDAWEWSIRDYDWWFEWACQAIVWGIAQYDAHTPTPRTITTATPRRRRDARRLKCAPLALTAEEKAAAEPATATSSGNPYASLDENAAMPQRVVDVHLPEPTEVPA
jgi:hypothetical protein